LAQLPFVAKSYFVIQNNKMKLLWQPTNIKLPIVIKKQGSCRNNALVRTAYDCMRNNAFAMDKPTLS